MKNKTNSEQLARDIQAKHVALVTGRPTMAEAESAATTLCNYLEGFTAPQALRASQIVFDIICHFSEEGTNNEQEARLRYIGCYTE